MPAKTQDANTATNKAIAIKRAIRSPPIQSSAINDAAKTVTTALLKTIISESSARNLRL